MNRASQLLGWAIYALCCTIIPARGQPASGVTKAKEWVDQDVQRHRWEINVNAGSLFKLVTSGTYQYNYLIKRNSPERNGKGRAWRFALSPNFNIHKYYIPGDTSVFGLKTHNISNINPMFVLGHEWQRIHGRTVLFGGVDLGGLLSWNRFTSPYQQSKWDENVRGTGTSKFHRNMLWLSTFLGAKIYLNHRISLAIESQVRFNYGVDGARSEFEKRFISRDYSTWQYIDPLSSYFISLSYNL